MYTHTYMIYNTIKDDILLNMPSQRKIKTYKYLQYLDILYILVYIYIHVKIAYMYMYTYMHHTKLIDSTIT